MFSFKKGSYLFFSKFEDIKREFKSISWSNRKEIGQTVSVVMIFIFFTSVFLWIIDSILVYLITKIM